MLRVDVGRFLGLRRITAIYLVVILLILGFCVNLFLIWKIQDIAGENAKSTRALARVAVENRRLIIEDSKANDALCVLRHSLIHRLADDIKKRKTSREFLKLTLSERIARYGLIGNISDAVVRADIMTQTEDITSEKSDIKALSIINCPPVDFK